MQKNNIFMKTKKIPNSFEEMNIYAQQDVEKHLIEKYNVARIIWTDQTSSSGDWAGLIVKKVGEDEFDLIEFSLVVDYNLSKKIVVGKPIFKHSVSEDDIDAAVEIYLGIYEAEDGFEDYDKQEIQNIKPKKEIVNALEIPF